MTQKASAGSPNIFPALRYQDAPAAIEWLVSAFGFEKLMVAPGPAGAIAHAELKFGPGVVMLGSTKEDNFGLKSPRELGATTQSVYICLDDVDAHYRRAKSAGAEMVIDVRDTDYGSREYSARDPEGHLWSFGTYRPADSEAGATSAQ
jgi:uncharacterized glyoxalase superfamily protein PhnB